MTGPSSSKALVGPGKLTVIYQLVYASSPRRVMSTIDLDSIIDSALRRNKDQHITGILFYTGEQFVQLLEGDREAVAETFGRICADDRHDDLRVVYEGPAESRVYLDWNMRMAFLAEGRWFARSMGQITHRTSLDVVLATPRRAELQSVREAVEAIRACLESERDGHLPLVAPP